MIDPLPIQPLGPFRASLRVPGSKSLTNRALLLAALSEGVSILRDVLLSDDSRRMIEALKAMGFNLEVHEGRKLVWVEGCGGKIPAPGAELMLGNAGTVMRPLTAACCLGEGDFVLDGVPRMRERPIGQLVDQLRQLGASIDYLGQEGYPPLRVHGRGGLPGGMLRVGPTLSSQYITALLVIAPYMREGLTVEFDGAVTSAPYVLMTLSIMYEFGLTTEYDPAVLRRVHV
ncbi:MAG: hypothetical protein IT442_14385, partial [Phycisphaeraceae bacterium]|nr:hypothetical protein [Phycisphaeraceae bacterium]